MTKPDVIGEIASECLMGRSRLVTRVLTGLYDEELRPFGVKASQLNLLVVVAQQGPIRRTDIGNMILLDPSTLTRNLQVMLANGWVEEVRDGEDGRGLPLCATERGKALLKDVAPAWRRAQQKARRLLGREGVALLQRISADLMQAFPG